MLGSDAPKRTSSETYKLLKREVTSYPSITVVELKNKHPENQRNISTMAICHRLQNDLDLPCRPAAKKPMLSAAVMKKMLNICQYYRHCNAVVRRKVMFSDDSSFALMKDVQFIIVFHSLLIDANNKVD